MPEEDKVSFNVTEHPNLAAALLGVYGSQVSGGKRYDLAAVGRRLANATFSDSHTVDGAEAVINAMDLTPLIAKDPDAAGHVSEYIGRMEQDITDRISRLS
jgi:hypothetical protein